jgi:hypothetical protein
MLVFVLAFGGFDLRLFGGEVWRFQVTVLLRGKWVALKELDELVAVAVP